jgi:hypothetical protein
MTAVEKAVLVGSASWNGAADYEIDSVFHKRATAFFESLNWKELTSISSSLRNGIPCGFQGDFSIGHFNMVRHIVFEDGISWVARLRLPLLSEAFGGREALDCDGSLKIEIASMNLLKYATINFG